MHRNARYSHHPGCKYPGCKYPHLVHSVLQEPFRFFLSFAEPFYSLPYHSYGFAPYRNISIVDLLGNTSRWLRTFIESSECVVCLVCFYALVELKDIFGEGHSVLPHSQRHCVQVRGFRWPFQQEVIQANCFALSPRRPHTEDKRMVLEHTHGLFIT